MRKLEAEDTAIPASRLARAGSPRPVPGLIDLIRGSFCLGEILYDPFQSPLEGGDLGLARPGSKREVIWSDTEEYSRSRARPVAVHSTMNALRSAGEGTRRAKPADSSLSSMLVSVDGSSAVSSERAVRLMPSDFHSAKRIRPWAGLMPVAPVSFRSRAKILPPI